jgi:RNA polymerase sigma-70 factor (ECF subfamily)
VQELHALLLRATRFEVRRRRHALDHRSSDELDDLAHQAAGDALVAILAKLDNFRGDSRFTTWAYKFALLEAAVKVRRQAWRHREVTLDPNDWSRFPDAARLPPDAAESRELLVALRRAIEHELTPHQREVLIAVTLNDVPIDVLAERLNTTRGALYKTLHDARRKLRAHLSTAGLGLDKNVPRRTR